MNRRFLFLLSVFVLAGSPVIAQEDSAEDVLDVLDVLAENPGRFSLVVYSLDDPDSGIYHHANVMRPLATTVKILVLAEYARRVAERTLDPEELVPLDSVETYYFPGTDRGAHEEAVTELRDAGRLANGELSLGDIADAMIRYNDNAAADYLMLRFGREAMDALPQLLDERYAEAPVPISGIYLNWDLPYNITDDATNLPDQDEDRAWMLSQRMRAGENFSDDMGLWMAGMNTRMSYGELSAAALAFPAGSTRAYAGMMGKAFRGELISEEVSEIMFDILDYEMDDASIRVGFDQLLATKSGSLAGIITSTYVADGKPLFAGGFDAGPTVLALFIESLPSDVFERWLASDDLVVFEQRLLTDPVYMETVRERLGE